MANIETSTNEVPSQFIPLSDAVKLGMSISGADSPHLYAKFLYYAMQCVNELQWDTLKKFKEIYLPVDSATKTAKLPLDYVQWLRIGLVNQAGEISDLTEDDNLVFTPIDQQCEPHCESCGCTSPLCAAISNTTTTTTPISINGTSYNKTVTICTGSDGTIKQRTCEPVVTNPTQACNYLITIALSTYPLTNVYLIKNGQQVTIGNVNDLGSLTTSMAALGFGGNGIYTIIQTKDVWTSFTYTDNTSSTLTINFGQSACVNPTPTVSAVCFDETICAVEILPCGCVVLTNEVINTLTSYSTMFLEFIQRDLKGMDFQNTFLQPKSYFGYFNISIYKQIIQLDQTYPYDTVYLRYYTSDEVDSADFLVPVFAKDSIAWYTKWLFSESRDSVPDRTKDRNQKQWLNKKRLLHQRLNPLRLKSILDIMRGVPPVRP